MVALTASQTIIYVIHAIHGIKKQHPKVGQIDVKIDED
jgi:hypothetical protein